MLDRLWTAPLAGISDAPFRVINAEFGAKHLYSEMISVEGLSRKHKNTMKLTRILSGEKELIVQLFGSKPDSFSKAVEVIEGEDYISEININSGCPVHKVLKSGSGAMLMTTPKLLGEIVAAVKNNTKKKVSVKLRSGWDSSSINVLECAKVCEDNGADNITIHPRTAKMMFSGCADWALIKDVKKTVKIPVIGNGDVITIKDAERMLKETSCDGVMIGRALVGNPWFFTGGRKHVDQKFLDVILHHAALANEFYGEKRAYKLMKKHLIYYIKNIDAEIHGRKIYYGDIGRAKTLEEELDVVKKFLEPFLNKDLK
ncbi:MAG: tRNA-dihydrouridine synthase family protein [Pseudomonadota bacterium]